MSDDVAPWPRDQIFARNRPSCDSKKFFSVWGARDLLTNPRGNHPVTREKSFLQLVVFKAPPSFQILTAKIASISAPTTRITVG